MFARNDPSASLLALASALEIPRVLLFQADLAGAIPLAKIEEASEAKLNEC